MGWLLYNPAGSFPYPGLPRESEDDPTCGKTLEQNCSCKYGQGCSNEAGESFLSLANGKREQCCSGDKLSEAAGMTSAPGRRSRRLGAARGARRERLPAGDPFVEDALGVMEPSPPRAGALSGSWVYSGDFFFSKSQPPKPASLGADQCSFYTIKLTFMGGNVCFQQIFFFIDRGCAAAEHSVSP